MYAISHTMLSRLRSNLMFSAVTLLTLAASCVSPTGDTTEERRDAVRTMRDELLDKLYLRDPDAQEDVESAAGYAAFTNASAHLLLVGGGSGYGVVVENENGQETFMRMAQGNLGPGLGVKEFRIVFVFEDARTMDTFRLQGWDFGASAEATAQDGDRGASATAASSTKEKVRIYQLTDQGVALTATVGSSRFWKDDSLN